MQLKTHFSRLPCCWSGLVTRFYSRRYKKSTTRSFWEIFAFLIREDWPGQGSPVPSFCFEHGHDAGRSIPISQPLNDESVDQGGQVEIERASGFVWCGSAAASAWGFLLQESFYMRKIKPSLLKFKLAFPLIAAESMPIWFHVKIFKVRKAKLRE